MQVKQDSDNVQLLGIMQYAHVVKFRRKADLNFGDQALELKIDALGKILNTIDYKQCIVFCSIFMAHY